MARYGETVSVLRRDPRRPSPRTQESLVEGLLARADQRVRGLEAQVEQLQSAFPIPAYRSALPAAAAVPDVRPLPVPADVFRIVVLCTGNRARSPIAAGFLRQLTAGLPVEVTSAGTLDLGSVPALPDAIEVAAHWGLDISSHRAQLLTDDDLRDADLVLGFERMHIVAAVLDQTGRRERTFTLPELAGLLDELPGVERPEPVQGAIEAVERAHRRRHGRDPSTLIELPDPFGRSHDYYRDTCRRLRALSLRLATGLFGSRVGFPSR